MKILQSDERPALSALLILFGLSLIGAVVGGILQLGVMLPLTGMNNLTKIITNPDGVPNAWLALILGQGVASFVMFVGVGWIYWHFIERKAMNELNFKALPLLFIFLLVVAIQFCFLPFNSWLDSINHQMKLPASMASLEQWMRSSEDQMAELTKKMTTFDSFWSFLLAILVVGVIAGIGEELIFRGLVQRKIWLGTGNIHVAIWLSAAIFSFVHLEFYGFLPRMLLGAIFGYLYYWSGNLWIPIFAHIFNNSFAVLIAYLENIKIISPEIENMDNFPLSYTFVSFLLTIGLMVYFRKLTQSKVHNLSTT